MRYIAERCFTLLCCLCLLTACIHESGTDGIPTTGSGFLLSLSDLSIQTNGSADTRTLPSELEKPVAANFQVTILPEGATQPLYEGPFTSDPIPAGAGRYTLKARCGTNPTLAWDTPYYEGSTEATVPQSGYTPVTIPCRVANALLSVRFSNPELFSQLYSDYSVSITHGNYTLSISPKNNSQSAYFPAGSVPSVSFTATLLSNGNKVSFNMDNDLTNVLPLEAGKHAILTLTASNTAFTIEKIEVVDASIDATVPDNWLPCPKVSGFGSINYVETNDAPTGAVISYTASRPIQAMELTFHFEDPQYAALSDKPFKLHELTEEERTQLAQIGITNFPQFGVDKEGSFDFAPLIATLQTNAGTTTVNTISLRLKANDRWSDEKATTSHQITVEKPVFGVKALPGNIWTKEFTLSPLSADLVIDGKGNFSKLSQQMSYQFSTDGTAWETLGSDLRKAGLAAATTYFIRGLYRGTIPGLTCEVKTYPQTTIDGHFENWYEQDGDNHYNFWYPYAQGDSNPIWNTKNVETTVNQNLPYCSCSGTVPTSDKQSGAKAALIRTVGYGTGNTWVNTIFGINGSIIYNKAIGELYLGSYNSGAQYGITYDSHPTAVTFYYKYLPYNTDTGICIVELIHDETNTVLATTTTNLNSASSYQKATITIPNVNRVDLPINKLSIIFKSGTHTDVKKAQKRDGEKEHFGSQLFIDEVALVYDK